jgi:hypothetical protein
MIGNTELNLLVFLSRTDREQSDFESLDEMTSISRYLSGLSKRQLTLYVPVSGPLFVIIFVLPKFQF